MSDRPRTLRELKDSGYRSESVKSEMRRNLIAQLKRKETLFPGILGYDDTVIPQVINAILSQHDILFLGLRGQGKTRMLRMMTQFLDDAIPVVAGSEIHDDPLSPLSKYARDLIAQKGDDTPIEWIGREERYHEKLATPDVTIADLIGEVDLIKHAEGRHLANEDVLHFGLIPRSHRGIFSINELPDLSPKIQVGLFNVLEERDIQIRGFTVRLPLDLCLLFSANPEDYTNRGRIVTPLKDRIGSVVRTHYPLNIQDGVRILEEQAWTDRPETEVIVPLFLKETVEEISQLARQSPHVNPASGVSVRMSVANLETLISNAEQRALLSDKPTALARVSDLYALASSSRGKLELNYTEDSSDEDRLIERIIEEAVKKIFDAYTTPKRFANVIDYFSTGRRLQWDVNMDVEAAQQLISSIPGFESQIQTLAKELDAELASGVHQKEFEVLVAELILNGLYAHNRLSRRISPGAHSFGQ